MQHPPSDTFERVFSAKEKAELRDEIFLNRELVKIDFAGADLRGAHFHRTALVGCNFTAADLRGASFILCRLESVVFTDTKLEGNRFDGTTFVGIIGVPPETQAVIEKNGGTFLHENASLR